MWQTSCWQIIQNPLIRRCFSINPITSSKLFAISSSRYLLVEMMELNLSSTSEHQSAFIDGWSQSGTVSPSGAFHFYFLIEIRKVSVWTTEISEFSIWIVAGSGCESRRFKIFDVSEQFIACSPRLRLIIQLQLCFLPNDKYIKIAHAAFTTRFIYHS